MRVLQEKCVYFWIISGVFELILCYKIEMEKSKVWQTCPVNR
jgi:hypothetical protein